MPGCLNELSSTRTCGSSRCAASHSVVTSASGRAKGMALLREGDIDPAILPALVLDFADHHPADLGGVADMGSAALEAITVCYNGIFRLFHHQYHSSKLVCGGRLWTL